MNAINETEAGMEVSRAQQAKKGNKMMNVPTAIDTARQTQKGNKMTKGLTAAGTNSVIASSAKGMGTVSALAESLSPQPTGPPQSCGPIRVLRRGQPLPAVTAVKDVEESSANQSNVARNNPIALPSSIDERPATVPKNPTCTNLECPETLPSVPGAVDHAPSTPVASVDAVQKQPILSIGQHLEARMSEVAQTIESTARMERCLSELSRVVLNNLGGDWEVRPFGSLANGFATSSSDLDVTLVSSSGFKSDAAGVLRYFLLPCLMQSDSFKVKEVILTARIPLVKAVFEGMLDVDVSCHNLMPLLNTKLLSAYSSADPRIRSLGVAVKTWARGAGVCDACQSNLSSYSFTLLVVYFLQVHWEVNLPPAISVTAIMRHPESDPAELMSFVSSTWQCRLALADLLAKFFEFYAKEFSWGNEVVSVRCAARLSVSDPEFGNLRGRHFTRLHIEDPFQLERNLHVVLGEREEQELRVAFMRAHTQISEGQTPEPLIPSQESQKLMALRARGSPFPQDEAQGQDPVKQTSLISRCDSPGFNETEAGTSESESSDASPGHA